MCIDKKRIQAMNITTKLKKCILYEFLMMFLWFDRGEVRTGIDLHYSTVLIID
jgi:hypothetical protein